ncbi:hypothetical protein ZWY2020_056128 [Hordeum vulgare]|nr:hypothetical protein ZWY2020_056128 [Hordeum vulgare]
MVDPFAKEATGTPVQEPRVDGHSAHETPVQDQPRVEVCSAHETPVQDQPRVEVHSAHETPVREASADVEIPGWGAWPERTEVPDWTEGPGGSGGGDDWNETTDSEGGVQVDRATVYKRGSTRLLVVPATREQRPVIKPEGDRGWAHPRGVRKANIVLGVLCRTNFPGFVTLPSEGQVPTLGFSWEHYQAAQAPSEEIIDGVLCHTRAEMVIKSFWTFYRCEEGYEEEAAKVLEAECRRLLQNLRREARPQAIRDYYATRGIKKQKECRGKYLKKDQYMKVALQKERAANEAALEKERLTSQAALEERDQTTSRLIEEERARNDAGQRPLYELFVGLCEKSGQVPPPMHVFSVIGMVSFCGDPNLRVEIAE